MARLNSSWHDASGASQVTGRDGSVQSPDYSDLRDGMEEVPLGNGDQWVEAMLRRNPRLALRILEVRIGQPAVAGGWVSVWQEGEPR